MLNSRQSVKLPNPFRFPPMNRKKKKKVGDLVGLLWRIILNWCDFEVEHLLILLNLY